MSIKQEWTDATALYKTSFLFIKWPQGVLIIVFQVLSNFFVMYLLSVKLVLVE